MSSVDTITRVTSSTAAARAGNPHVVSVKRGSLWTAITGTVGAVMGLAPHVLHHIGPLVGTFLVAGAGGTAIFGVLGLSASVPMLIKLRARFSSWWAPAIALAFFVVAFSISTFVVGPLINAGPNAAASPATEVNHAAHHRG